MTQCIIATVPTCKLVRRYDWVRATGAERFQRVLEAAYCCERLYQSKTIATAIAGVVQALQRVNSTFQWSARANRLVQFSGLLTVTNYLAGVTSGQ